MGYSRKFHHWAIWKVCSKFVANFIIGLFGVFSPSKYCLILLKFWPEVVSIKTQCLKNPSKFWVLAQMERTQSLQYFVHFWVQFTTGKPKESLKTKISAEIVSLVISKKVNLRPQKNHRILVELSKKTFFGLKLGLNYNHGAVPCKCKQKFSHSL